MSNDLYIIPFIVFGKRLTVSIEVRARYGVSQFDREIFGYDSACFAEESAAELTEHHLPEILNEAQLALSKVLEDHALRGARLTRLQQQFVDYGSRNLNRLVVDCGHGERDAAVSGILAMLMRLGLES